MVALSSVELRETSRPRPGRRFAPTHERELFGPAVDACKRLPKARSGLLIVQELSGPIGIPDFTALVGAEDHLNARLSIEVPPLLNRVDVAVMASVSTSAGRTTQAISAILRWPEETIARRIPWLLRVGALREVARARYVRPPEVRPLGRIYAVEAKVRDWRRALRQVRTYSVWADSYVLVMGPLSSDSCERLAEEVRSDKGGLVVNHRWITRPMLGRLSPAGRLWAAEHLIAALYPHSQPSVAP
jgi:hypothetical protein